MLVKVDAFFGFLVLLGTPLLFECLAELARSFEYASLTYLLSPENALMKPGN